MQDRERLLHDTWSAIVNRVQDLSSSYSTRGIRSDLAMARRGGEIDRARTSRPVLGSDPMVLLSSETNDKFFFFKGNQGVVTVKLPQASHVSSLRFYHGDEGQTCMPRQVAFDGLTTGNEQGVRIVEGVYAPPAGGDAQAFASPKGPSGPYEYVRMRVLSNYGDGEKTCLYRYGPRIIYGIHVMIIMILLKL